MGGLGWVGWVGLGKMERMKWVGGWVNGWGYLGYFFADAAGAARDDYYLALEVCVCLDRWVGGWVGGWVGVDARGGGVGMHDVPMEGGRMVRQTTIRRTRRRRPTPAPTSAGSDSAILWPVVWVGGWVGGWMNPSMNRLQLRVICSISSRPRAFYISGGRPSGAA